MSRTLHLLITKAPKLITLKLAYTYTVCVVGMRIESTQFLISISYFSPFHVINALFTINKLLSIMLDK